MQSSRQEKYSYEHFGDDEAQLPMYEAGTGDEAAVPLCNTPRDTAKPCLPDQTASPAEVREFITQLLIATRGLTEEHCRAIASKWALGSGHELLEYPAQMYHQIFGSECGWTCYKEVMLLKYETSHPHENRRRDGCIGLAVTIPMAVLVYFLFLLIIQTQAMWAVVPLVIIGMADGTALMIFIVMAVKPRSSALDLVEDELKDGFFEAHK